MPLPPSRQVFAAFVCPRWIFAALLPMLALPAAAQYPGHTQTDQQKKAAKEPRAISVLEWVGAPGKPVASRLVPVAVYVDGEYQDGGLYLAQPAPLTVQTDTLYELEKAGVPQGTFYIAGGEEVAGSWFGYGKWRPLAAPKPVKKLPQSKNPPRVVEDNDPDRPQFKGQGGSKGSTGSSGTQNGSSSDPSQPTLHRHDSSDSGTGSSSSSGSSGSGSNGGSGSGSSTASNDPDQPTLHRRSDTDSDDGSTANAPDDPNRPHFEKHSAASAGSAPVADGSPVSSVNEGDPDRPKMFRGEPPASQKQLDASKLTGMPADLQQMAAVSDPAVREEHPFAYQWPNPDDAAKMKLAVEALAAKAVLAPEGKPFGPAAKTAARASATKTASARHAAPKPPQVTFSDEVFRAYELSYGGGETVVFTAKADIGPSTGASAADAASEKYVTIVAQPDFDGVPQVRLQSVTDKKDLDVTPRMRLVDAVDTRGDGRGDLLFELRRSNDRQFAIYHVRGTHAEQAFATESLPIGAPNHSPGPETSSN